jgi:hypothetical protein
MKKNNMANERAQMLKYHIQTSGRSLHAQEIDFNDIRTTLQACTRFMTIVIHYILMPMMRQSQHQQRSQCVVQWRFS